MVKHLHLLRDVAGLWKPKIRQDLFIVGFPDVSGIEGRQYNVGEMPIVIMLYISYTSRALSLRNLVSGYACGRVFPAGVGPGSPSRDAANWLPSRSDLSVETWRQYGWLRMVFSGVRLFRAPIWWPSGGWRHARGREHCRGEPGGSLSGGYAPDSAKAEGSSIVDEPGEG